MPAVAAGGLLFVSGQDPEARGRLVYRGRVGADLTLRQARAAARLATWNALAAARATVGSLARVRRCVAVTCFVDAAPGALTPSLTGGARALLARAFGAARPPLVWLRPARGLAGGMPVEVELVLELRPPGPARLDRVARARPRHLRPTRRRRGSRPHASAPVQ